MKYYFTGLLLLICIGVQGVDAQELLFRKTVHAVIDAFSKQDSVAVNKLLHPAHGLCLLFRQGVFDNFESVDKIGFRDEGFPGVLFTYAKGIKPVALQYGRLPVFSCDKEAWSKTGCWTDNSRRSHIVSEICKTRNKLVPDHIPTNKIKAFYVLESKSRRVVVVGKDNLELVFYLSYLGGRWYLTIFDTVSSDCSA